MLRRQRIASLCQIVILIDQADIQTCGTWHTVVAVDAFAVCLRRGEGADDAVVERFLVLVIIRQHVLDLLTPHESQFDHAGGRGSNPWISARSHLADLLNNGTNPDVALADILQEVDA